MSHDATKVLLGSTQSSMKKGVISFASDPATFLAGLAVRRNSSDLLSVTKADGMWAGVSLGKTLSDSLRTQVLPKGLRVPILLEAAPARGIVTITSFANLIATSNDTLQVGATTFTFKASVSTSTEVLAATSNAATAAALVAKINAHSVAGPLFIATAVGAVVTITAKNNVTDGATIALVYVDVHGSDIGLTVDHATFTGGALTAADFVVKGAHVYISDTTGKADDPNSAATLSRAIYTDSSVLTGIDETGASVACVLVDMQGGL